MPRFASTARSRLRSRLVIFLCTIALGSLVPAGNADEPTIASRSLPEHKILATDEGTWDATVKTWMAGPDAEPSISKGTEVNEVLPGGLWVLSKFEGEFGGMKFSGRGQFGYDPVKKKYVGTWVDSMSTILSVLEGDYDPKTKTMTYVGDGYDAEHKAKFSQKMVTTYRDDGSRIFTLYMKFEGQPAEAKFMEITYTKRK